jgi:hypothetical protein
MRNLAIRRESESFSLYMLKRVPGVILAKT